MIPREKLPAFERMLWFACRGNVFLRYDEITSAMEDPVTVRLEPLTLWVVMWALSLVHYIVYGQKLFFIHEILDARARYGSLHDFTD